MVGVGRFEGDDFHLAQFFLRDPAEEPAMLAALDEFLAPCQILVTFNGKSFDLPLLQGRFITNGWEQPWAPDGPPGSSAPRSQIVAAPIAKSCVGRS